MVDLVGRTGPLTTADFEFRVGNDNSPGSWPLAPAPASITIRDEAGTREADRVTLVWQDGAIKKQWLQITVKANANTGLASSDVFYFGNAVGESGNDPANAIVNSTDELGARNNAKTFLDPAAIDNVYDFNRDGFVNATDQILARSNSTTLATALKLISVPGSLQAAAASSPSVSIANELSLADGSIAAGLTAPASSAGKLPTLSVFEFVPQLPPASLDGSDFDTGRLPVLPPTPATDRVASSDQELDLDEHLYDLIAADLVESRL